MADGLTTANMEIPSYSGDTGKKPVDTNGMNLLEIINMSFDDFRTAIKEELAKMDERLTALEKKLG